MIEKVHKIKAHSNSQLDIVDIGSEADLLLINDVAAARAKLQLVAVLDGVDGTLLLSSSMSLLC